MVHINLPRGAEQETLCKTCHNPDGQAAGMGSVGNHEVNGGSIIIDCTTCHNPHVSQQSTDPHTDITADNLSLVRSTIAESRVQGVLNPVIFQDPSHLAFGEDNPPWNAVCQACHTQTNHHTNDDSADHDHEIAGDCTGCHRHGDGFGLAGAACDFCHGYPPTQDAPGGSDGLVYLPKPTGSQSAGAHSTHAITAGYACETCHTGGMPESPVFGNDLIQIGFNVFDSDGTGTSYDGQVLDPPYDYEGANNTTVTATGSMTCDNIYCHGTLADGTNWGDGTNTSPAWDGTLACGDCHLATNDNPLLLGSHEVHNQIQSWQVLPTMVPLTCLTTTASVLISIATATSRMTREQEALLTTLPPPGVIRSAAMTATAILPRPGITVYMQILLATIAVVILELLHVTFAMPTIIMQMSVLTSQTKGIPMAVTRVTASAPARAPATPVPSGAGTGSTAMTATGQAMVALNVIP
jgi:predicted CxxxxCH...CXXCH cytochrome family protein